MIKENFTGFLNRNYCITAHLAERLDEIVGLAFAPDFQKILGETIAQLELNLDETNKLFELLDIEFSISEHESLILFLEEVFAAVQKHEDGFSTFFLLDYICITESLLQESALFAELSLKQIPELQINNLSFDIGATLRPLKALITGLTVPA